MEILDNINAEHRRRREKAREMLYEWMRIKGNSATIQLLFDALIKLGETRIAQKLLGEYVFPFLSLLPNPSHNLHPPTG